MRIVYSFLLILFSISVNAQEEIRSPFDSPIIAYYGLGFYIPKTQKLVIVDSQELRIEEDSTHFIVKWGENDENFLILGEVRDGDTINLQRFEFQFIPIGRPVVKWKCQNNYESGRITLHKDSLEQLQEFYVESWRKTTPAANWKIHNGEIQYSGLKSRPPIINSNFIPNEVIDSLSQLGDTFQISLILTISMQDEIRRKIAESVDVILLEGKDYARYLDPQYDYKHYNDTVYLKKDVIEGNDTILLKNRGHLYIGLPRLAHDYEVYLEDKQVVSGDWEKYTKVPKGEGFFIYNAHAVTGRKTLHIRFKNGGMSAELLIKKVEVP